MEIDEAPRSSLLPRSSHFGYEGWKLRGNLRNSQKPLRSFAKAKENKMIDPKPEGKSQYLLPHPYHLVGLMRNLRIIISLSV